MVWGASWDPTGRYSTMEPSGSTFRGPWKLSEVGLTVKKGLKGGEKSIKFFCPKTIQYVPRVDEKLRNMKNRVHTCPKTTKKLFLSAFFSVKMGHFFAFFVIICIKIAATNFAWQLREVCWYWWLHTCIEGCLALVSLAQVWGLKRNGQNAPRVRKS